ncbi:hypothetical protein [Micromonospora aurantiaca (nom. illeg.)]|uniref:hypothetical protein n=1 Tax=Micromonospora aurantiaca (nom. illeg.) TaxID=47850 RepID=UPI00340159B3
MDASARDLVLPETFSADLDDPGLERLAAEIQATAAHEDKIALVGVVDELRRLRADLRGAVRAEASVVGARVAAAEDALKTLRATRAGLLLRMVGWGEDSKWKEGGQVDFAEVGRLGSMTRQAARKMLAPFLADGGADTPE